MSKHLNGNDYFKNIRLELIIQEILEKVIMITISVISRCWVSK